ncbi:MAG: HNH endonuclease [Desulfomonilia bacterium]
MCGKEAGRFIKTSFGGFHLEGAHIHHIKEVSKGGDHSLSNLQLLCKDCHALKHPKISNLISSKA